MRSIDAKSTIGLICLIGLMGISGCSSGQLPEPVAEQQIPVNFSGQQGDLQAATRATTSLQETGVSSFKVWGYKNMSYDGGTSTYGGLQNVFPAYTVNWIANSAATTTTNSHEWEYVGINSQTIKYWDFSANAYRFFAYASGKATVSPATSPSPVTEDTSDATKVSFTTTIDCTTEAGRDAAPYFSELWFSNDKLADYGKVVTLQFIKPFARVRFQFIYMDRLDVDRSDLSLIKFCPTTGGIATAGSVTVNYPLTGTGTKETWSASTTSTIPAFTVDEQWYYVMPAFSQSDYRLEVAVVTNELQTATVPSQFMQWQPGFQYTYVFKITKGGSITLDVIQVAMKDWNEKSTVDRAVYNW